MSDLFNGGIRPAIDAYLKKKSEETRSYGDYWSASSAGYCQRLVIMRRLGVPRVPELQDDWARTTRVFESGHIFHEWMQRITKNAGISIAQEVELQDEDLMIRGHFDDLILVPSVSDGEIKLAGRSMGNKRFNAVTDKIINQHLILYDYKTANSKSFDYPKPNIGYYHKMQLGTYMYMLRKQVLDLRAEEKKLMFGKESSEDINALESLGWRIGSLPTKELLTEARILTLEKDTLRMKEHDLHWSPELENEVKDYWTTLNKAWEEKRLPACTCLEHDGGFLGKRTKAGKVYNDFYYQDKPCSLEWAKLQQLLNKELLKGWTHVG